jgi:DNA-directed RNA polymerase subunit RPC12/RpoP
MPDKFFCPGSKKIKEPQPYETKCSKCGKETEIWTDEILILCPNCGGAVYGKNIPSCIEWCEKAKECVGEDKYNAYLRRKEILDSLKDK